MGRSFRSLQRSAAECPEWWHVTTCLSPSRIGPLLVSITGLCATLILAAPSTLFAAKDGEPPAASATAPAASAKLSNDLLAFFRRIDELGRASVEHAKFVKVTISSVAWRGHKSSKYAWLVGENDKTVTLLQDDLVPWSYNRRGSTKIPSNWDPAEITLSAIEDADLPAYCEGLIHPEKLPAGESARAHSSLFEPGPSEKFLVAHAAWKKGLSELSIRILSTEAKFHEDFAAYQRDVLEDLAWLHCLRAVNLLMYADRKEVLTHLKLVSQLSPQGKFAAQARDLATHMERLIAKAVTDSKRPPDQPADDETERARRLISQLVNLHCIQIAQPGNIDPFMVIVNGQPFPLTPARLLVGMGMKAVPTLIEALDDQTPTRTVYHWRDFYHDRLVWRVSDFAWFILREITGKEFGARPVVGFTFSSMRPVEQRYVIAEIKRWYATNKNQSPDERMFGFFSSHSPNDWTTAGQYFLKKRDARAVPPLLQKIPHAGNFVTGDLCELVARFGDKSAKPMIRTVLQTAREPSDRIAAAIALWDLGDDSGVPLAIQSMQAKEQPYGNWEEPIWFLMRAHNAEAMQALKTMLVEAPPRRAAEIIRTIEKSITGDLWGKQREPAGCVEICPALIAAMERAEPSGETFNDNELRVKDTAARTFAMMRQGFGTQPHAFMRLDPALFNDLEPDKQKRDLQISALKKWYHEHKSRLQWDAKSRKLVDKEK